MILAIDPNFQRDIQADESVCGSSVFCLESWLKKVSKNPCDTVDGSEIRRSPPAMSKTLKNIQYWARICYQPQLVQDFFHQQYLPWNPDWFIT